MKMDLKTRNLLKRRAEKYERFSFTENDPSQFMHLVKGHENQEATAFVASSLSYGSRSQFLPKIKFLLDEAQGDMAGWISGGGFEGAFTPNDRRSFYRFFTYGTMNGFFRAYKTAMDEYGSLGNLVAQRADGDAGKAVEVICNHFKSHGSSGIIPADATSACKRICMFLRWMTRDNSPVDLGLWSRFIDRKTLIIPLDTHVLKQASELGLAKITSPTMNAAKKLTAVLAEVFPDDPVRGDFALFGFGVENAAASKRA